MFFAPVFMSDFRHQLVFGDSAEVAHFGADRRLVREVTQIGRDFALDILVASFLKIGFDDLCSICGCFVA